MIPSEGTELSGLHRRLGPRHPPHDSLVSSIKAAAAVGSREITAARASLEVVALSNNAADTEYQVVQQLEQQQHQHHQQHDHDQQELLLADLVSYEGCQQAVREDPAVAAQLYLQFQLDKWVRHVPSRARRAADEAQRVPEEELGLFVAPRPRINDDSLYKLEQRLARALRVDPEALSRHAQQGAPLPAPRPGGVGSRAERWWFGANGLMQSEPDPLKPCKERPSRRWDQDEEETSTAFLAAAVHAGGAGDEGRTYRLDIELGRLEFWVHPLMAREHQLAAKLLSMYGDLKRRQSVGLGQFYAKKLAALEDALLAAREAMFAAQEGRAAAGAHPQPQPQQSQQHQAGEGQQWRNGRSGLPQVQLVAEDPSPGGGEVQALCRRCANLEWEVAETRQLLEEDQQLLAATVEAMGRVWGQLQEVRARQGCAMTDVQMHVVKRPPDDDIPMQQDGLTRRELDVALLVAEREPILGLQDWPCSLPAPDDGDEERPDGDTGGAATTGGFRLRRVESACAAHALVVAELTSRLALLKGRVSADPDDPEFAALEQRLAQLGTAPRRAPITPGQSAAIRASVEEDLAAGRLGASPPPALEPVLTVGATVMSGDTTGSGGPRLQGPKFTGRCRYYARLVINGKIVGTSQALTTTEDFMVNFTDVFSIRLLKWPESVQLQLWEVGTFQDRQVASLFLPVPGAGGTPHIDPRPQACSWSSPDPIPQHDLIARAAALRQGGPLLPLQPRQQQQQPLQQPQQQPPQQPRRRQRAGAGAQDAAEQRGRDSGSGAGGDDASVPPAGEGAEGEQPPAAGALPIFPSGVVFVRSGWVPEDGFAAVGCGAFGGALSAPAAAKEQRPHPEEQLLFDGGGGDATATLTVVRPFGGFPSPGPRPSPSPGPGPVAGQWRLYDNPLSVGAAGEGIGRQTAGSGWMVSMGASRAAGGTGGGGGGPSAASAAAVGSTVYCNPLAATQRIGWDAEVGASLMPPQPRMTKEKALRRALAGGKASRDRAAKWLEGQPLDPNDPRNAELLELLRARDAGGAEAQGPGGLFRLGVISALALASDRPSDQRAAFLRRRWEVGAYRQGDGGRGAPKLVAPLSSRDTAERQDLLVQALARVEAAALGLPAAAGGAAQGAPDPGAALVGGVVVAGRRERAALWAQGALARALEQRQERIRAFALRLRAAGGGGSGVGGGRGGPSSRRVRTEDVVKDAALPEFKLDLSSLVALLQPARPLRPRRKVVRRVVASVPRETALVVTIQRASNLPARLAQGGAQGRRASPTRGAANRGYGGRGPPGAAAVRRSQGAGDEEGGGPMGPPSPSRAGWGDGPGWEDVEGQAVGGGDVLSCFVEAVFRGQARRTAAVDSNAPIWNEQVAFPVFGLDQEASPMALKESDGVLTLNVFDEIVTAAARQRADRDRDRDRAGGPRGAARLPGRGGGADGGDGRAGSANAAAWDALTEGGRMPERERRFLGCLRVPLAAIYQAESIEGSFRLEVPPVILGYQEASGRPASLACFVTLRPRLAAPAAPDEERVCGEQDDVVQHARRWVPALQALPHCRGRAVRALAVDPDGLGTLLPRYVSPTRLPPAFGDVAASPPSDSRDLGRLMLSLARWAARVPFIGESSFRRRRVDVWCGSAEALELGGGDHEEHAHLLAGFFLEIGRQALIVLGCSLQGPAAAFVLTTGLPADAPEAGGTAKTASGSHAGAAATAGAAAADGGSGVGSTTAGDAAAAGLAASAAAQAAADVAAQQQGQQQQQQQPLQQQPPRRPPNPSAPPAAVPWDASQLRLWNPLTGGCVPVTDAACELREVGTVYSSSNVWANVQSSGHPWDMSWDLGNGACWRPFFGPVLPPREMAPMQVPPAYCDLDPRVYEELEARVEETVRSALYEARSVVVTQPNNKLSRVLKALLRELPSQLSDIDTAGLEASAAMSEGAAAAAVACGGGAGAEALRYARERLQERLGLVRGLQLAHNERVAREMRGCSVNGHVLALPFSDSWPQAVTEAVLNAGVHRTVDPRVKFAMASYVEPLGAAFVCCMWIYVAAVRDAA